MTDNSRIIWSYTEGHLREWMAGWRQDVEDGSEPMVDFPDPAALTAEQVDELYRRIKEIVDSHLDFPHDEFRGIAWEALTDMGLLNDRRRYGGRRDDN